MTNRTSFRWPEGPTTTDAALTADVGKLAGVTEPARVALSGLGIVTVFDLAASSVFADARAIALGDAVTRRLRVVPSDILRDIADVTIESAAGLPLSALRRLGQAEASAVSQALAVSTLWDLAHWPPYLAARDLMQGALNPNDDEGAEALRPLMGQYPTERVYYTTFVMLDSPQPANPVKLEGPVGLRPLVSGSFGFRTPAVGAMLTIAQSWHAQGITLGQLLHSLALAPGESTRLAVIDWARRTSAKTSESVSEEEQLDNSTTHARALSEVQEAVADEMQEGGSTSKTNAKSKSSATAETIGAGGLAAAFGPSWDASSTSESAASATSASSSSWSTGNRSVLAQMNQNVNDRTEQHASSVRSRRATAVREVAQSEHESVSTRVVANYNHMHALTVQYYEVVQIYRTVAELNRADRCIFIPVEPITFSEADVWDFIERFRGALARAAISRRARSLLLEETSTVTILPSVAVRPVSPRRASELVKVNAVAEDTIRQAITKADGDKAEKVVEKRVLRAVAAMDVLEAEDGKSYQWNPAALAQISRVVGRALVRPGSDGIQFSDDTVVEAISFERANVTRIRLGKPGTNPEATFQVSDDGRVDLPDAPTLAELDSIHVSHSQTVATRGAMFLHLRYLGRTFTAPAIPLHLEAGPAMQRVVRFESDRSDRRAELLRHLRTHREHYAAAIYRSLDGSALALLLSPYVWQGRSLLEQIEPKVLAVMGNYVVLRAPVSDDEPSGIAQNGQSIGWRALLEQRGLLPARADERLVPIHTGGVFAEAVLGRANSAEKLDMTRFWNWQDSPIPMTATDIAPIATGSRAEAENLQPGQLGAPVLNIVNPTALPDPAGLGAVLTAVSNGNMFRDMSGLQGTQALAQAAMQETLRAATAAGSLASENLKASMQKQISALQIAADVAKTMMGGSGSGAIPPIGGVSGEGARLNYGRDMDARGVSGASKSGEAGPVIDGGGTPGDAGGGSAGGGGGDGGGGGWDRSVDAPSHEASAFNRAVWGTMGESGGSTTGKLFELAKDDADPLKGGGGSKAPPEWAKIPSVEIATKPSEKVYTTGATDRLVFEDRQVSGLPTKNWRDSSVEQYGGTRVDSVRARETITAIVLHESINLKWQPLGKDLSVQAHVERDGTIIQHNQFLHRCQHVGAYNEMSIGIENVNPCFVQVAGDLPSDSASASAIAAEKWSTTNKSVSPEAPFGFMVLPPLAELEACYQLVVALSNEYSIPMRFPQVLSGMDIFPIADSKSGEDWFIGTTHGEDYFAAAGIAAEGVISHSALTSHDDGASVTAYCFFRNLGCSSAVAAQRTATLFDQTARYQMRVHKGLKLHLFWITDLMNTPP